MLVLDERRKKQCRGDFLLFCIVFSPSAKADRVRGEPGALDAPVMLGTSTSHSAVERQPIDGRNTPLPKALPEEGGGGEGGEGGSGQKVAGALGEAGARLGFRV